MEIIGPMTIAAVAFAVDLFFMIKDETGDAKKIIGNAVGMMPLFIISSLLTFNIDLITGFLPFALNVYMVSGAMVLILGVVIHAKSAVFGKGPGSHVTWMHSLLIAAIIGSGPFAWPYLSGYIAQYLPV